MEKFYQRFNAVVQKFGLTKQYFAGDFYRIYQINPEHYSIARLKAGPCGESLYQPQLKIAVRYNQLSVLSYFDNVKTPTQSVLLADETTEFLETEFIELLCKFEYLLSNKCTIDS